MKYESLNIYKEKAGLYIEIG